MAAVKFKKLLITLVIFNVVDWGLTTYIISRGGGEANPIMRPIMGTAWGAVVKLIIIPLACLFLWYIRDIVLSHKYIRMLFYFVFSAYVLIMIYYAVGFYFGLFIS